MPRFTSLLKGSVLDDPAADFRGAARIEKYRVSGKALYVPSGFSWTYLPLGGVLNAEEAHRSVTAGHCVSVTEKRPRLDLTTEEGVIEIDLERPESMRKLLEAIRAAD